MAVINRSQTRLAEELQKLVLEKRISPEEGLQILICYLVRQGTITEFGLPTPTE